MKQEYKNGYEYDARHGSRKYHHWNAGALRYVKNNMTRRVRKDGKAEIVKELNDLT